MAKCGWVLCALHIVKRDAAEGIGGGAGICSGAGFINGCPGEGTRLASQRLGKDDLAEAVVVEVFRNDQCLREAHQHAFVALGDAGIGKGNVTSVGVTEPVPH